MVASRVQTQLSSCIFFSLFVIVYYYYCLLLNAHSSSIFQVSQELETGKYYTALEPLNFPSGYSVSYKFISNQCNSLFNCQPFLEKSFYIIKILVILFQSYFCQTRVLKLITLSKQLVLLLLSLSQTYICRKVLYLLSLLQLRCLQLTCRIS